MANFVTDKAIFQCAASPANQFICREPSGHVVKGKGGCRLLTDAAELSAIPTPCTLLTARNQETPTPCSARFTGWQVTDHAHTVRGKALLTESSFRVCQDFGAPVKLQMDPGQVENPVRQGGVVSIPSQPDLAPLVFTAPEKGQAAAPASVEHVGHSTGESASPAAAAAQGAAMPGPAPAPQPAGEGQAEGNEGKKVRSVFRCPRCAQKEGCPYRKAEDVTWESVPDTVVFDGQPSSLLRKNYLQNTLVSRCRESDESEAPYLDETRAHIAYEKARARAKELKKGGLATPWRHAAHHLISVNQGFTLHPDVVRMANHSGYDINGARNCIMLLTSPPDYGTTPLAMRSARFTNDEGDTRATSKKVSARDAMREGKIQWHVGGHAYMNTLKNEDNIEDIKERIKFYTKKEVDHDLQDYASLIRYELDGIKNKIGADLDECDLCPKEFVGAMDGLSGKVRSRLAAFGVKYHHSYPWYVSREAFCFAFGVPPSFLLVGVRKTPDGLRLERCRISRKQDGTITIRTKDSEHILSSLPDEESARRCILFCENVRLFVFLGQCGQSSLPFKTDLRHIKRISYGDTDFYPYIEQNAEEFFLWAKTVSGEEYMAPTAMIRARLAEYNREKQQAGGSR